MYELPDPQPLAYAAPPVPPPRRISAVISWLLILASVAYLAAGRPLHEALARRQAPLAATPTQQPSAAPMQLRLAARYAVGVHQLTGAAAPTTTSSSTAPATEPTTTPSAPTSMAGAMLPQVDEAAAKSRSPHDVLRAATIAGEISGPAAALERIDKVSPIEQSPTNRALEDADALRAIYTTGPHALTPGQRDGLVRRLGWFGELALSYGKPADDPQRREAVRPAVRTAVAMGAAAVVALAALATGLVLLIVAVVRASTGGLRPAYVRPAPDAPTHSFLEAFAGYLAGMLVVSTIAALLFGRSPAGMWFVVAVVPLAIAWPLLRGVRGPLLRQGLGWTAGRGVLREVGAGFLAYLAGLPVLAAGAAVTLVLQRLSGADTSHPIVDELARGGGWRTLQLVLLAAAWAPLVEESMFRGAFYHHLRRRLPWPLAATLVGLVFAAVHPQGWAAVPVLGAIGFCFATAREWRGSIIAPAVAHALNNGAVTLLLVLVLT